jgi:hypothetical protein
MAFLGVCIYALACIATAFGLTIAVDGTLPTSTPFGPETLGFNGIMIGMAMMPEHFFLVPQMAASKTLDANPKLLPFRFGFSPSNSLFLSAAVIGVIQSLVVFFLWRTATSATQMDAANTICGIVTFVIVIFDGVLLASICANALALQSKREVKPKRRRRKGRTK